jgi:hypothetical protein
VFNKSVSNEKRRDNKLQFLQAEPYYADYRAAVVTQRSVLDSLPDPHPVEPGDHSQHDGQKRHRREQAAKVEP